MSTAWDAIVRAWLVVRTWMALRRTVRLSRLAAIRDPMRFLQAALIQTGPSLALAIAVLPRRRRTETTITFVACQVLRALDEMSADRGLARARITAAAAYLAGEVSVPPRVNVDASQQLDALLVARLPFVRAALDALPGDTVRQCCDVIEQIAAVLLCDQESCQNHADHMRGEAVFQAFRLLVPAFRVSGAACRAVGRAIPLAHDLRAAAGDRARDITLERALPSLAFVPRLLRWLPASIGPGTRAAMTLLATTTFPFSQSVLVSVPPRRLRHPLRAAIAAAYSRRAYLTTVAALEGVLYDLRPGLTARLHGPDLELMLPTGRHHAADPGHHAAGHHAAGPGSALVRGGVQPRDLRDSPTPV